MPAALFKEFELTVLGEGERLQVFYSSGTTEQKRSRHYHSQQSIGLYEASLLSWFRVQIPVDDRMRIVSLTPAAGGAPNSSLVHMFDCVGQLSGGTKFCGFLDADNAWSVDFGEVVDVLGDAVEGTRPVLLMGTAFSFVHLLDWMKSERKEIRLPNGSKLLETGGYKGRSREVPKLDLYKGMQFRFGVPDKNIVCEYGMSELSSQAYDTSRVTDKTGVVLRCFRFPPWARAMVISPETGKEVAEGEIGLLRIYDLANVYSVMAVQTEDLAVKRDDAFELIGRMPRSEPRGCSLMPAAES